MLPAGEQVREVWLHQGGLIEAAQAAGQKPLLIDCSTIDVASARAVDGSSARQPGWSMLDAPVSGGTVGAAAGTLTFMVGGIGGRFRARDSRSWRRWARTSSTPAAAGAGQAAKICNNMMLAINMIGVAEGFLLAQKPRPGLGQAARDQLRPRPRSPGRCRITARRRARCRRRRPTATTRPGFMAALMLKDVKLSQAAAEATGVPTPLAAHAVAFYQPVVDAGDGAKDFSVVFRWLSQRKRHGEAA